MKRINKYLIFSFIIAFLVLLFTSKNSFLYVFNDWVDANSFFTLGKGMFNGLIPYKDIFEQKGPLLYLIYGIGYLISHKTFHGVFILEVISLTIFLYYTHKIFTMYFDKKYSLFLLPSLAMIITVSIFFAHGGSCEEFCLPFFAVSTYYYIKHFIKKELTKKEILINGLIAGCILMMKYTLLGFWIAFCLFVCINYLRKKEIKKALIFCLLFLLGMLIPFMIGIVYFSINNGIKEFINVYFIFNITAYSDSEKIGIIGKIIEAFKYMFSVLIEVLPLGAILLLALISSFITTEKNKLFRLSLVGLVFITLFFMCWGLKWFIYYFLPVLALTIIILEIFVIKLLNSFLGDFINNKYTKICAVIFILLMISMAYLFANYNKEIAYTKKDYVQFKYAKYMNKYKNPTLLNMGFIDFGIYTISGILPNTRYYEKINISYAAFSELEDSMKEYVENKETKFVVYISSSDMIAPPNYIYDNYKLVFRDVQMFENTKYNLYFFELKDLKNKT